MPLDTAGFIDGAQVTGEMMRRSLWITSNGANGIARAGDLAVRAATTPTSGVWVQAGGGIARSPYVGSGGAQSYSVYNRAAELVPIPANTGAADAYWRVIVRVKDPQYAGEATPKNPLTDPYSVLEAVGSLPTTKPYIWLATVVMPAGASTVGPAQIIDRREMANPRWKTWLGTKQVNQPTNDPLNTYYKDDPGWEIWPDAAQWTVEVPDWATQVRVRGEWSQVLYSGSDYTGNLRVQIGYQTGSDLTTHVVCVNTPASGGKQRATISCADTLAVPAALRGQSVTCHLWGQRTSGATASTYPVFDWGSAASLDLMWVESPVNEAI